MFVVWLAVVAGIYVVFRIAAAVVAPPRTLARNIRSLLLIQALMLFLLWLYESFEEFDCYDDCVSSVYDRERLAEHIWGGIEAILALVCFVMIGLWVWRRFNRHSV